MGKYVKISVRHGGSYVQPREKLAEALDAELDGLEDYLGGVTITFRHVEITDKDYENLPEFIGH